MTVGIVTDSGCDLPPATLRRYGVAAVPLRLKVGDEIYRDWRELEPVKLYDWMRSEDIVPQVLPPEVADFAQVYTRVLGKVDYVVSIHHASRLSETLNRGRKAADALGARERIRFFDAEHAGAAQAEMVLAAAEEAAAGGDLVGVVSAAERVREHVYVLFSPDSVQWLEQSGRRRKTLDGVLGMRPLLTLREGELADCGSVRRGGAVEAFVERLVKRFGDDPIRLTLAVAGDERELIEDAKDRLERSPLNIRRGRVQLLGAVLGTQLGPGALGVCAYPEVGAVLDI